jgi:hypothetical protein
METASAPDRVLELGSVPSVRKRLRRYWVRHRTLFWTLHSLWALAIGIVVLFLARERYGFVPWVVLFLVLAWASTLFFGRRLAEGKEGAVTAQVPELRAEVTSYLTRAIYQETLFFLLPFYWYSTVVESPNIGFTTLLVGLAVFSCVDLVFDRWLRTLPIFGLVFFATVAFAAINLLLPMLVPFDPAIGTPLAAVVAVGSAIPLAMRGAIAGRRQKIGLALLTVGFLALAVGLPRLVPPVPLRLQKAVFTTGIDESSVAPADTLGPSVASSELPGALLIVVEVFAPSNLPASVRLDWKRDDEVFRSSREIEITAHDLGFRVWDGFRPDSGLVPPGRYEVLLRTSGRRVFGMARIDVL